MDESLKEYRSRLEILEQKAQEDFDKTVLSLSGGALGISFAFIKDIVNTDILVNPLLLILSWICWGLSVAVVLVSYYTSHLALRKAIRQVDVGDIRKSLPGGIADYITAICNALGGILFFIGIVLISVFVWHNME
jgi:hypothetical protein